MTAGVLHVGVRHTGRVETRVQRPVHREEPVVDTAVEADRRQLPRTDEQVPDVPDIRQRLDAAVELRDRGEPRVAGESAEAAWVQRTEP